MGIGKTGGPSRHLGPASIVALLCLGVGALCVQSIRAPLTELGDVGNWGFLAHFVRANLTWDLVLRLPLVSDDTLYPTGIGHSMMSWCLERDLLNAAVTALLGPGPYLQLYFLFSLVITGLGAYAVLGGEIGTKARVVFSTSVVALNFYGMFKYPHHLNVAAAHWGIIGVLVDLRVLRDVSLGNAPSLRWVALRCGLLAFSLGLDLVYIAGFSLASLTLHILWAAPTVWRMRDEVVMGWRVELQRDRAILTWIGLLSLLALYVYLPLVLQIVTRSLDDFPRTVTARWAHIGRALFPYIGSLEPNYDDLAEGDFDLRLGITLLALLAVALARTNKRALTYLFPSAFLTLAAFLHSAAELPTLSFFPWLQHARVGARWTLFLPAIICFLASRADWGALARSRGRWIPWGLVVLGALEIGTMYPQRLCERSASSPEVARSLGSLAQYPGEAIMEWPFCVIGGNSDGMRTLCPHLEIVGSAGWQYLHGKKTVSTYLGRLSYSQVLPVLEQGWVNLLARTEQGSCFDERGWEFFERVLQRDDFAGLLVYERFVAPACLSEFGTRFGDPELTLAHDRAGPMLFWSRTWATHAAAPRPRYLPSPPEQTLDLVDRLGIELHVFGLYERESLDDDKWRWSKGPVTEVGFARHDETPSAVWKVHVHVPKSIAPVRVLWNGSRLRTLGAGVLRETWTLPTSPGPNRLRFEYDRTNHRGALFAPNDPRYLGAKFYRLEYVSDSGQDATEPLSNDEEREPIPRLP